MDKAPIIDFSKCRIQGKEEDIDELSLQKIGYELYRLISSYGYVIIANHGISKNVIKAIQKVSDSFFSKPVDYKLNFFTKDIGLCYDPLGGIHASPDRPCDFQEGLRIPFYSSNGLALPDVEKFEENVDNFKESCTELMENVLRLLGRGMRLQDKDFLYKSHSLMGKTGNRTEMKLIHYQPISDDGILKENQIRIVEHTDFTTFSLLFHDGIMGLQAQKDNKEFVDVPYIPDTILLIVGDMMQYWTDNQLKALVHRVILPPEADKVKSRRTVGYFATMDDDVLLKKLDIGKPQNKNDVNTENDKPLTSKEYYNMRFADFYMSYR